MMVALYFMVALHFNIRIIYLNTASLLWLGSFFNFTPMYTKESLMVLDDCWIIWMNLSSSVVDKYRLFMELIHLSKASDRLSWRWTIFVDVLFAVYFFTSSFSLLLSATCLYCTTLTATRYISKAGAGFLLVVVYSFSSFTLFFLSIIINYLFIYWRGRTSLFQTVSIRWR